MSSLIEQRLAPTWTSELLIDGKAVIGDGTEISIPNPATEQTLHSLPQASTDQVEQAVRAARRAFDQGSWASMPGVERSKLLHAFVDRLDAMQDQLISGVICEVGTPLVIARGLQTTTALETLRTYADLAARDRDEDLGRHPTPNPSHSVVAYRPTGVVAVITAYNQPLLLAARTMGAALAAGCTVVLLPSPRAPLTTLLMATAARDVGIPDGVLNVIVGGPEIGKYLCVHPGVDKIAFTGSLQVGREIMAQAAGDIKRLALELGGKSPSIVMPGCDVASIIDQLHVRYLRNSGQGCAAPARILVHRPYLEEFCTLSRASFTRIKTGNPWDDDTTIGPLIRPEHLTRVLGYVERALASGGTLIAEGAPAEDTVGWYMSPRLVGGVTPDSSIAQDELFGPVGVVLPYDTMREAIALANGTPFGLSAAVYCTNLEDGKDVAAKLRSGSVIINGGGGFRPDAPFGGFKRSGFGREYGEWGVREFLEPQHIQWSEAAG